MKAISISDLVEELTSRVSGMELGEAVKTLNLVKQELHKVSPFSTEPVDCVLWVGGDEVEANDYNPNSVAPPEMELLAHSIVQDGYTQPIVAWPRDEGFEVIDGFHRNRVGKENEAVRQRVHGYLPVSVMRPEQTGRDNRIAATIRHNRARGKHRVEAMSDIVVELKRRNWTEDKIGRELGMDPDEVLRLTQITGMAELFSDEEFSKSWDVANVVEDDIVELEN